MRYSDLFTPIEAFAAFIMKNVATVAESCNIGDVDDFDLEFIRRIKREEICRMTISKDSVETLMICQLFNVDCPGFPETAIDEALRQIKSGNRARLIIVCPGIYPQLIEEIHKSGKRIDFLCIDGDTCGFIPFPDASTKPIEPKTAKKDEKV